MKPSHWFVLGVMALSTSLQAAPPAAYLYVGNRTLEIQDAHVSNSSFLQIFATESGPTPQPNPFTNIQSLELRLANGQIILGARGTSSGSNSSLRNGRIVWADQQWELGSFRALPWNEQNLDIHFTLEGKPYQFTLPNPGYRANVPAWAPPAGPLVWTKGELTVKLESLTLKPNTNPMSAFAWVPNPKWTVTWHGHPTNWFSVGSPQVEDASGQRSPYGGLLNVSAWKLHSKVWKTTQFPLLENEIRWFGWLEAERFKNIPPGECDLLSIDEVGRSAGIYLVGWFAPGDYDFTDGKLVQQAPPGVNPAKFFKASYDPKTGKMHLTIVHHTIVTVTDPKPQVPGWREMWQERDGRTVGLGGQGTGAGGLQVLWSDPPYTGHSVRFGIGAFGAPEELEMLVAPPQVPK